jgi:3-methyladenine DNA glycosylase AlkD
MSSVSSQVDEILRKLEKRGSKANRDGMARYGIVADKVFGVSVETIRSMAKEVGKDHELALALWDTGWYEARMMTPFIDEPLRVTSSQMDAWARDFDNWAICDGLCFHLFDKTGHKWKKIQQWSSRKDEFVKRAAFALLAGVALHDKKETDAPFMKSLSLIERAADDERNFVKKGVSWALRSVAHRNKSLHAASLDLATRLAESDDKTERWIGKDVIKDITRPIILQKVAKK